MSPLLRSLIVLFVLATSISASADEPDQQTLEDLLLFEVHLGRHILADGLNAYREGQIIFLPLGEFSDLLTISMNPDVGQMRATGFIISEERQVYLDLKKQRIKVDGKELSYDPKLVRVQGREIYIEHNLYSTWFPVDLSIDIPSLILKVSPREKLPIQLRLERERRVHNLGEREELGPDFQNLNTPYSLIDRPMVDQTVDYTGNSTESRVLNHHSFRYTTTATGDLLGLETHLMATGSDKNALEKYRLTMGRNDPDGKLVSFGEVRSFAIGHVSMPALPYVVRSNVDGRGVFVSNRLLSRPTQFDTQTFTGDLSPGWDVELIHNGVLIEHQKSNESARYEFKDIPLLFGSNDFRLIFYGPLGQRREESFLFLLEDSMVLPGERYYTLSTVHYDDGSRQTLAQVDQSIGRRLSAAFGFVNSDFSGSSVKKGLKEQSYYSLGFRSYLSSLFLTTDAIVSSNQGVLGAVGARTGFSGASISLAHAVLDNFTSEEFLPAADPQVMKSKARLDTFLPVGISLPFTAEMTRAQLKSGRPVLDLSAKLSAFLRRFLVSHRIRYLEDVGTPTTLAELQLSGQVSKFSLRGGFGYKIDPVSKPESIDLSSQVRLSRGYIFNQNISTQLENRVTRFEGALNKAIGDFGLTVRAGGTNRGEVFVGLRVNMGIGVESRSSAVFTSFRPMSSSGAVSTRVFIDENLNGEFDDLDTPVSNVGFRVDGSSEPTRTDANGVALITHLPTNQRVNVGIDRSTLDDPQLSPQRKGIRLLARAGKLAEIDFPLSRITEIDGTVTIEVGDEVKPAPNLQLELVEYNDREYVIGTTVTAIDGFYILTDVSPGRYVLRVEAEQAKTLRLVQSELMEIRVLPNSDFISGMDVRLRIPLRENQQKETELLPPPAAIEQEPQKELFYVILDAFAKEESYAPLIKVMEESALPYVTRHLEKEIKVYWVIVGEFETEEKAQAHLKGLVKYGYQASLIKENEKFRIRVGSFYRQKDAIKGRAVINASIPVIGMRESTERLQLIEIGIGGYRSRSDAETVLSKVRKLNFPPANVQKRSPAQWHNF